MVRWLKKNVKQLSFSFLRSNQVCVIYLRLERSETTKYIYIYIYVCVYTNIYPEALLSFARYRCTSTKDSNRDTCYTSSTVRRVHVRTHE